ncbi:MAG: hypothetical protein IPH28_10470 [Cytophagaceae bacterium]|nr:hypothetical protein [Cytophagaceae bacterium]MBK9933369.1 hypothetical protein [Cytophagaceae bacterium]MBL0302915.1 hypothetical protein [Cytophagaceae bacterium]MBL0325745.1 hypothetical protein [Cytophagaceae bacterium]
MNKVKIYFIAFYLFSYSWAFAIDDKPGEAKKNSGLKSNVNLNTQNSLQLSLLEINEKLEQNTLKADLMTDLKEKLSLATIADRGKAQGTFEYLEQSPDSRFRPFRVSARDSEHKEDVTNNTFKYNQCLP